MSGSSEFDQLIWICLDFNFSRIKPCPRCSKNSFLLVDGHLVLFIIKKEEFYRNQKRTPDYWGLCRDSIILLVFEDDFVHVVLKIKQLVYITWAAGTEANVMESFIIGISSLLWIECVFLKWSAHLIKCFLNV